MSKTTDKRENRVRNLIKITIKQEKSNHFMIIFFPHQITERITMYNESVLI